MGHRAPRRRPRRAGGAHFEGRILRETPNEVVVKLRYGWFGLTLALIPLLYLQLLPDLVGAWVGLGWFAVSFALIPVMRRFARTPRRSPADVRIDAEGVRVDGKRVLRRRGIRSGGMMTAPDGNIRVMFEHETNESKLSQHLTRVR